MDLDHEGPKVIADRQAMQELDQNIIISQEDRPINGSLVRGGRWRRQERSKVQENESNQDIQKGISKGSGDKRT